jgi:hypothetical protein
MSKRLRILFEQKALGDAIISLGIFKAIHGTVPDFVICNAYNSILFDNHSQRFVLSLPIRKDQRKLSNFLGLITNWHHYFFLRATIYLIASSWIEEIFCRIYFPFSKTVVLFRHHLEIKKSSKDVRSIYTLIEASYKCLQTQRLSLLEPKYKRLVIITDAGSAKKQLTAKSKALIENKYDQVEYLSLRGWIDSLGGRFEDKLNLIVKVVNDWVDTEVMTMDSFACHFLFFYK